MNVNAIVDLLKEHLESTVIVGIRGRHRKGKWIGVDLDANLIVLIPANAPESRLYVDIASITSIRTNVGED